MFIKRVYRHYTVHETFIMKSCLHVDLMHCIHIEFVDPPSKTVYNILINTVNSIHGQPLSSNHLYLKFAFSCPFTDIFIWNEPFTTGLTTYFTDWCLSIYTNLNKVITIQIWWTGYGIRHSRFTRSAVGYRRNYFENNNGFLVKGGTCFKRQFGSLWLCIVRVVHLISFLRCVFCGFFV